MRRVRVAALQYFIRPVTSVAEFQQQAAALIETAADYECGLILFPEYFTIQLLTLGNVRRPIRDQLRDLAAHREMFVDCMAGLARQHGIYVLAGTLPVIDVASESAALQAKRDLIG